MSENKDRKIVLPKGGVFDELLMRVKLVLRLLADSRVNPLLKLMPIGSVLYMLFPDLAPGPVDDVAIVWLGAYLFVELCPPDVVQEHMDAMKRVTSGEWHTPQDEQVAEQFKSDSQEPENTVIDAEYWEKKD